LKNKIILHVQSLFSKYVEKALAIANLASSVSNLSFQFLLTMNY